MLKRIAVADLELGMFVEKMQGSWFDHPFWKARFLIEDEKRLKVLKASKLEGLVIDTSKGKDVASKSTQPEEHARGGALAAGGRINSIKSRKSVYRQPPEPISTEREVREAQVIADRAKDQLHKVFASARLGKAMNVRAVEPVVSDILNSVRRNPQAFGGLMRCKLKNEMAYRHALSVSVLMLSLARQMKLTDQEIRQAGLAGLLLDIGINYFPQNLTPPNGDYRNLEPKIWQQHVLLGYRVLQDDDNLPETVLDACLKHHERLDGSGFPNGLREDEIGQLARMAAICDAFDFMLTNTIASEALDPAAAICKLQKMEEAFDQDIVRSFIDAMGLYPVGAFVRLRSGKLAMVIDEDPKDSSKPIVAAFYSLANQERLVQHKITLARPDCDDDVLGVADLTGLGLPEDGQLRELIFLAAHNLRE